MMATAIEELQKELCRKYGADFLPSPSDLKVGIATNVCDDIVPINGFRHPPQDDTTGWYIYAGEAEGVRSCLLPVTMAMAPTSPTAKAAQPR